MHSSIFFFNDTATTEIYTLSLHDALPIYADSRRGRRWPACATCRTGGDQRDFGRAAGADLAVHACRCGGRCCAVGALLRPASTCSRAHTSERGGGGRTHAHPGGGHHLLPPSAHTHCAN